MQKWIFWFLCKELKIFDSKLIRKIEEKFNFYTILKYSTICLIWCLICLNPIGRSEMEFISVITW